MVTEKKTVPVRGLFLSRGTIKEVKPKKKTAIVRKAETPRRDMVSSRQMSSKALSDIKGLGLHRMRI